MSHSYQSDNSVGQRKSWSGGEEGNGQNTTREEAEKVFLD